MNNKKTNVFLMTVWLAVDLVQWRIHSSEYATITGIKAVVVHKRRVGKNWDKTGLYGMIKKFRKCLEFKTIVFVVTIFSMVLVIVEYCNTSRLFNTTTAGVVKKNSMRKRKLLIKISLKYQNRDPIDKLLLKE